MHAQYFTFLCTGSLLYIGIYELYFHGIKLVQAFTDISVLCWCFRKVYFCSLTFKKKNISFLFQLVLST